MFTNKNEALIYLFNRYNISYDKQSIYKDAFTGMLITYGFPKNNDVDGIVKFFDDNIEKLGLHNVRKLYCNINIFSYKEYVNDLKINYNKFSKSDDFDNIERITKKLPVVIKSVDDMISLSELSYINIKAMDYGIAHMFFKNKIPANIFNKLLGYRNKQVCIEKSNIPYINGKLDDLEYESVRVWDGYLMYFDCENNFKNCHIFLKEKLMTSPNYRLITIKKDNKTVNHVVVEKNKDKYKYSVLVDDEYDYNNIINKINDDIIHGKISNDPPKVYTPEELLNDEEGYLKAYSIYEKAFTTSRLVVSDFKHIIEPHSNDKIWIGRDYFILTEDDENTFHIHYVARHNEGVLNEVASYEFHNQIIDIINSTNKKIEINCYRTSYYMICKLASLGLIYIDSDKLLENLDVINSYKNNNEINERFHDGRLNNEDNYSKYYNNVYHNRISFYSMKNLKITDKIKFELEKQKLIYGIIVKRLDEARRKAKYKDLGIKNLDVKSNYTDVYKRYILEKRSLGIYTIESLNSDVDKRKGR